MESSPTTSAAPLDELKEELEELERGSFVTLNDNDLRDKVKRIQEGVSVQAPIVPAEKLMSEVMTMAEKIAEMSHPAAEMAKRAINRAFETPLSEGLQVERDLFRSTFALEDRSEGMAAFIEKRKPVNKNR